MKLRGATRPKTEDGYVGAPRQLGTSLTAARGGTGSAHVAGGVGGCLLLDAVPDLDILVAVLRAAVVVHPGRCPGSGSARRCGGVQVWCAGRCPARGGNGPQISMHNYAAAGPTQLVIVGSVSRE